ncbi:MAG: SPOR domain-containing protein [Bacteroidetes bacterium]|nr:SPOR domain-containing protein [Bacteroidota bacterium]
MKLHNLMKMIYRNIRFLFMIITFFIICSFTFQSGVDIIKPSNLILAQENQKNERSKPNAQTRDGYKVLLYFTDDKSSADNIKSKFDQQFNSKFLCTVEWYEPKFKVFAGSFLTRAEAVALLYKVRGIFPNAMIVKTKI